MFNFFFVLLMTLFVIISLMLILIILIQKGRGGGLASAFGGAGGHTAFGAKTGDVLTWATSIIFGIFLVLAIVLNLMANATTKPVATNTAITVPGSPAGPSTPAGGQGPSPSTPVEKPSTQP